eukprot:768335-Hanusia_phi.AAC.9
MAGYGQSWSSLSDEEAEVTANSSSFLSSHQSDSRQVQDFISSLVSRGEPRVVEERWERAGKEGDQRSLDTNNPMLTRLVEDIEGLKRENKSLTEKLSNFATGQSRIDKEENFEQKYKAELEVKTALVKDLVGLQRSLHDSRAMLEKAEKENKTLTEENLKLVAERRELVEEHGKLFESELKDILAEKDSLQAQLEAALRTATDKAMMVEDMTMKMEEMSLRCQSVEEDFMNTERTSQEREMADRQHIRSLEGQLRDMSEMYSKLERVHMSMQQDLEKTAKALMAAREEKKTLEDKLQVTRHEMIDRFKLWETEMEIKVQDSESLKAKVSYDDDDDDDEEEEEEEEEEEIVY